MQTANSLEKCLRLGKTESGRRGWSEDEVGGWHHQCSGRELGRTSGGGEGQGGLACFSPWGHRELDTTGRLNNSISSV